MNKPKIKFQWVKFYKDAKWQIVKFWTENGKEMLKGLDWASDDKLEKFNIVAYGPEITYPDNASEFVSLTQEELEKLND